MFDFYGSFYNPLMEDLLIKEAEEAILEDLITQALIEDALIKEAARREALQDVVERARQLLAGAGTAIRQHPLAATLGAAGIAPAAGLLGALTARAPEASLLARLLGRATGPARLRRGLLFSLLGLLPAAAIGGYAFAPQLAGLLGED